jgi:hypothetical protein
MTTGALPVARPNCADFVLVRVRGALQCTKLTHSVDHRSRARLAIFCAHGFSHQPDAARHLDMTAEENYTC